MDWNLTSKELETGILNKTKVEFKCYLCEHTFNRTHVEIHGNIDAEETESLCDNCAEWLEERLLEFSN